ncbi:glycosyltransferase family 4 protein [Kaustia mangrovi]|uniref:glycosyltransferase family 4 protein n=1 Tax=Kaustia mangrovi TaxID=2593653 RepID=UPI001FE9CE17|nr:glycosyltransferase family 4 protein [Kaustia mangrovi]
MVTPIRAVHILRAPVGGLFRHVCDLARAQAERGIEVGIICAPPGDNAASAETLETIEHVCALGVYRIPMGRLPGPSDIRSAMAIRERCARLGATILHGHGAKGGAYARLVARGIGAKAVYTPHGGSLHYGRNSPVGLIFLTLERLLLKRTDRLIFVCAFERDAFIAKVGRPPVPASIVHNGIGPADLEPVRPAGEAADIVFVGELRMLKGVDVLLRALAGLKRETGATATIVGAGPDEARFRELAHTLKLHERVRFAGALPAREAFGLGRLLVVPSRAESFPYIVLEAAGAGVPLIASRVGGIPEILTGEFSALMVPPDNAAALSDAIDATLSDPDGGRQIADRLAERVADRFSIQRMADDILAVYRGLVAPEQATKTAMLADVKPLK